MTYAKADEAMTNASLLREDCPVCNQSDLLHSVTFEALPALCNVLPASAADARAAATGRFTTTFCRQCTHIFNATFEEERIGYTQSYENSLHFSPRFVAFVDDLAARLNSTYALAGKTVVDVGCGKGDFLKRLCAVSGAKDVGFDKSFEANRGHEVAGVRFVNAWFGETDEDLRPDFVSCRHVVEHIAEPVAFLQGLRAHPGVGSDTVFYFEVPNALYTLRDLGIWDLIYEHASYFTPASLCVAVEAAGFEVLQAGTSFGDQYLFVEARPGTDARPPAADREIGNTETLVRDFDRAYRDKVTSWRDYLAARDPAQVVVWGAGSKGVTFVNVVPQGGRIGALVDVNPHKQGRFAPGAGTPVLAPEALRGRPVQSIIVMNPLYRNEIAATAAALGLSPEIIDA